MVASSSGLKTHVAGSVPAALMSSNTEASQEKVSRAEGTCRAGSVSYWLSYDIQMTCPHVTITTTVQIPSVGSLEVPSLPYRKKTETVQAH